MLSLIFTEKVVNLRAWQLYLGNSLWTLFVGIVLLLVSKLFGLIGVQNSKLDSVLDKVSFIAQARDPRKLTEGFNTHMLGPGGTQHIFGPGGIQQHGGLPAICGGSNNQGNTGGDSTCQSGSESNSGHQPCEDSSSSYSKKVTFSHHNVVCEPQQQQPQHQLVQCIPHQQQVQHSVPQQPQSQHCVVPHQVQHQQQVQPQQSAQCITPQQQTKHLIGLVNQSGGCATPVYPNQTQCVPHTSVC